jgi:AcrR family transcriptional regulator
MGQAAPISDVPGRFVVHNTHEQIQASAVRVVAAKGYRATSVRDICAEANTSAKSFHMHFSSAEEVVLSAVEAGFDQAMGTCQESFHAAPSWPDAVWDGLHDFTDWIACEPAFARTMIVELLAVGPAATELLHSLMDSFAIFLAPGYTLIGSKDQGLLDEAITSRLFELLHAHITHESTDTVVTLLPELARTALTPFLGPEATEKLIARRADYVPTLRGSA